MSGVAATTHGSYEIGPSYEQLPALEKVPTIQRYFKDNGYWYVGASYHRPFGPIAVTESTYNRNGKPATVEWDVSGIYLTLDIRYFFHEDPERRRVRTK